MPRGRLKSLCDSGTSEHPFRKFSEPETEPTRESLRLIGRWVTRNPRPGKANGASIGE
jgi:hypothetical protein